MQPRLLLWPIAGILRLLARPRAWPAVLLGHLAACVLTLVAGLLVCWAAWPNGSDAGWLTTFWQMALAIGYGLLTFLATWILVVPVLLATAYEHLVCAILRADGHTPAPPGILAGTRSAVGFVLRTLHWRLGWLALGLLTLVFPPLSWLIGSMGLGHVVLLDACETALSQWGLPPAERARLIAARRGELLAGGFLAGLMGQALASTVIGWVFWVPGLYTAAASTCPHWVIPPPHPVNDTAKETR